MKQIVSRGFPLLKSKQYLRSFCSEKTSEVSNFDIIMKNNKEWAASCIQKQPDFFSKLVNVQTPKYLWIGCSDSRVPAN